jgi:hypothetical protein
MGRVGFECAFRRGYRFRGGRTSSTVNSPPVAGMSAISPIVLPKVEKSSWANWDEISLKYSSGYGQCLRKDDRWICKYRAKGVGEDATTHKDIS